MADLADVEMALVGLIATALYPDGSTGASAVGAACSVYRGWPVAAALDEDLAEGAVNVSVFPVPGSGRNTTRWPVEDLSVIPVPTLLTTVIGCNSVLFSGNAAAGQVAGILVNGTGYAHRTQAGDTPATVATALGGLLSTVGRVWIEGPIVTMPDVGTVLARVVADGTMLREVRRQEQTLRVSLWCPDPTQRDAVASVVDAALAVRPFMMLSDGSLARLRYAGTTVIDTAENARLFRRELLYVVEYGTTLGRSLPAMLFGTLAVHGVTFDDVPAATMAVLG